MKPAIFRGKSARPVRSGGVRVVEFSGRDPGAGRTPARAMSQVPLRRASDFLPVRGRLQ